MIASGRFRHRVSVEKYDYLRDSSGEAIQNPDTGEISRAWMNVADLWCAIEPLSGKEFIQSQSTQSKVTGRVVIRWFPGIDAGMRFRHQRNLLPDLYFNIEAILPDKESGQEYMTCLVSYGVNEG